MRFLLSHVARSMLRIKFRLVVIAMICATTVGVIVGAYSAITSLFSTVENIQVNARMADLELIVAADDEKNLPDFTKVEGVQWVARRLLTQGLAQFAGRGDIAGLFIGADAQQFQDINRLRILEGGLPRTGDMEGVVLERNCAKHYDARVGDVLPFKVDRVTYSLVVRGVVESPEYLVAPMNPGVYVPASGSLCVIFGQAGLMHEALGFRAVNSVLFGLDSRLEHPRVKAAVLERAQSRLTVDYAMLRSEQFSQKFLELDLHTFGVFLPVVILIYAASSSLVVFFLMFQWIKEERPLIAMLQVLGYSQSRIALAYLLPAACLVLLGLSFGMLFAVADMWAFGTNYAAAIGMPSPQFSIDVRQIALAAAVSIISIGVGMYFPLRSLRSVTPIEALSATVSGEAFQQRWWQILRKVKGPFWLQYALRNLVRSSRVSFISAVAVAASLAITIAFYISLTSMEKTALGSLEKDRWHAVVDMDAPLWSDEIIRLEKAVPGSKWSGFVRGGAQVSSSNRLDNVFLVGVDAAAEVRHPIILEGRMLVPADRNSVVIERRLAADHKLAVGSDVTFSVKGSTHVAKVVGILSGALPGEVVAPRQLAQSMLGLEDQYTGAFLVAPDLTKASVEALYRAKGVSRVTGKPEIIDAILSISGHIWTIIHLSAGMSITIAALFLLTSSGFTILGRRAEYGMLRIMGFADGTVTRVVLTEAVIIVAVASVIAVPVSIWLGTVLNDKLTDVWFKVNTLPSASDFYRILVPALLFVPLATWPAIRALFAIAPIETLKQRKFG